MSWPIRVSGGTKRRCLDGQKASWEDRQHTAWSVKELASSPHKASAPRLEPLQIAFSATESSPEGAPPPGKANAKLAASFPPPGLLAFTYRVRLSGRVLCMNPSTQWITFGSWLLL